MSDIKRKKFPPLKEVVTPIGVARYPWLSKPDTKFDADGVFKVDLLIEDVAKIAGLQKQIEEAIDQSVAQAKEENPKVARQIKRGDAPIIEDTDEDGNPTGKLILRCKTKAVRKRDGESTPKVVPIFDAAGKRTKAEVWGGSKLRLRIAIKPYFVAGTKIAGVSLDLREVQVIELVQGGSAQPKGFDAVEGGWTEDQDEQQGSFEEASAGEDAGDDGDF